MAPGLTGYSSVFIWFGDEEGEVFCWEFIEVARCLSSLRLTGASKPGKRWTSLAHSAKPARNLFAVESDVDGECWTFWRYLTVISRMSAFSSLECLAGY